MSHGRYPRSSCSATGRPARASPIFSPMAPLRLEKTLNYLSSSPQAERRRPGDDRHLKRDQDASPRHRPSPRRLERRPGKNKAPINGRPLIDYTVSALAARDHRGGNPHHHRRQDILSLYADRRRFPACEGRRNSRPTRPPPVQAVKHALDAWVAAGQDRLPEAILLAADDAPPVRRRYRCGLRLFLGTGGIR